MKMQRIVFSLMLLSAAVAQAQQPVKVEYFLDKDPGYGNARSVSGIHVGDNTVDFDISDASCGFHLLSMRCLTDSGRWSTTLSRPIFVIQPLKVSSVEYFIDTDPGFGQATSVSLPTNVSEPVAFDVDINTLAVGTHQFSVRARDGQGLWSVVWSSPFEVIEGDTGLKSVQWTSPFRIDVVDGQCMVSTENVTNIGQVRVEVFSTSGVTLSSVLWNSTEPSFTIPVRLVDGQVAIVRLTSLADGLQVVRRIITD